MFATAFYHQILFFSLFRFTLTSGSRSSTKVFHVDNQNPKWYAIHMGFRSTSIWLSPTHTHIHSAPLGWNECIGFSPCKSFSFMSIVPKLCCLFSGNFHSSRWTLTMNCPGNKMRIPNKRIINILRLLMRQMSRTPSAHPKIGERKHNR